MNRFEVRPACAADVPTIHALIAELALYEKEPEAFVLSQEDLLKHGFGQTPPLFEVCVADGGAEGLLGMAMVYTKYSSWRGPCLFLEDLVVREPYRRLGVGKALLTEVLTMAAISSHSAALTMSLPNLSIESTIIPTVSAVSAPGFG